MQNKNNDSSESCACNKPGSKKSNRWILVALALAVIGVVAAKHGVRQRSGAPAASTDSAEVNVVQNQSLPRLVELGADKCQACKMMVPVLDALRAEYADLFVTEFVDVWEQPEAAKQHKVKLIPTQVFYDAAGRELYRHEGFFSKDDIVAKWQELGVGK